MGRVVRGLNFRRNGRFHPRYSLTETCGSNSQPRRGRNKGAIQGRAYSQSCSAGNSSAHSSFQGQETAQNCTLAPIKGSGGYCPPSDERGSIWWRGRPYSSLFGSGENNRWVNSGRHVISRIGWRRVRFQVLLVCGRGAQPHRQQLAAVDGGPFGALCPARSHYFSDFAGWHYRQYSDFAIEWQQIGRRLCAPGHYELEPCEQVARRLFGSVGECSILV